MSELSPDEQREMQGMVRELHRQLIIGDESNDNKGFIKSTNERLAALESVELTLKETQHVKRIYSIISSWKWVLGLFVFMATVVVGIGSIVKILWDIFTNNT